MPWLAAAISSSRIAAHARPTLEIRSRAQTYAMTRSDAKMCHTPVWGGTPPRPYPRPVIGSARIAILTTSPNASVAIARYTPRRRNTVAPSSTDTITARSAAQMRANGNGKPALEGERGGAVRGDARERGVPEGELAGVEREPDREREHRVQPDEADRRLVGLEELPAVAPQ